VKKEFVERMPRTLMSITRKGRNAFRAYKRSMSQVLENLP